MEAETLSIKVFKQRYTVLYFRRINLAVKASELVGNNIRGRNITCGSVRNTGKNYLLINKHLVFTTFQA